MSPETTDTAGLMRAAERVVAALNVGQGVGGEYLRYVACGTQIRCMTPGRADRECIVDLVRVSPDPARNVAIARRFAGAGHYDARFGARMQARVLAVLASLGVVAERAA